MIKIKIRKLINSWLITVSGRRRIWWIKIGIGQLYNTTRKTIVIVRGTSNRKIRIERRIFERASPTQRTLVKI